MLTPKRTFEEFSARCIWFEHIRLREYLSDFEAHKHLRKVLKQMKSGNVLPKPGSEYASMVQNWYALEYEMPQ